MKKAIISTIIIFCCILFYKKADAAVIFNMDENTVIDNILSANNSSSGKEIEIKNMVSVVNGQSFSISQVSSINEVIDAGGIVDIENAIIENFPEEYNYNPGVVEVDKDNYIKKVCGTGTAVIRAITTIDSVQSDIYFAIKGIDGDISIYNAIENINGGKIPPVITGFEDANILYKDYYEALKLIKNSENFTSDINIQHDGLENTWKLANGYKFIEMRRLFEEYFSLRRFVLSEVQFISEYEGIVLKFANALAQDDILSYSFYKEKEFEPDNGITINVAISSMADGTVINNEFTLNVGISETRIMLDKEFKEEGEYTAEVSGNGPYTSKAVYTFEFIFNTIDKGAFVKKKTKIYSSIYNGQEIGTAAARTRYNCIAKSSSGWFRIKLPDGTKGYIVKDNVSLSESAIANIVSIYDAKYSYADMSRDIKKMAQFYQDVIELSVLSRTADNNNIYCVRLGNKDAKKKVVIQSAMHAREWLNSQLLMKMLERCCKSYYSGKYGGVTYKKLFNNVCFYIVPMLNPDGVNISQYGLGRIKSASLRRLVKKLGRGRYSRWKANAKGVDLNKNFSAGFRKGNARGSKRGPAGYSGPYVCSERESRALQNLVNKVKPKAVINYHEAGRVIYYTKSSSLTSLVRQKTGYRLIRESIKGANGSFGDWLTRKGIAWCTPETCIGTAPVGHSQFYYEWGKHRDMIQAVAKLYKK